MGPHRSSSDHASAPVPETVATCPLLAAEPPPDELEGASVEAPAVNHALGDHALEGIPVALTSEALRERVHAELARRVRPRWESTSTTNDPVVAEKRKPYVAARRARFVKIVQGALAACVALCATALVASAKSGATTASDASASSRVIHPRRAPAVAAVEVESLATVAPRAKATRSRAPRAFVVRHDKRR